MNTGTLLNEHREQEIAIIGMSGRFPGAQNIEQFWRNLCAGVESISSFSDQELLEAGLQESQLHEPHLVRAGGVLEGAELFDASFFGYSPAEATYMDPQQRLLLEAAWHALEHAGYNPATYQERIGVYAGLGRSNYLLPLLRSGTTALGDVDEDQLMLGNDDDFLATRISYKLNLRGPSFTVQTACSTSLVAVHVASQALLSGECDLALAGGVSVRFPQKSGFFYQEGSIDSPDGHCRAFDAQAQGTVSGSGLGLVVLKRLNDALEDRDTICAIIKGSAINNDGSAKVSYTAPGVQGQTAVISEALAMAGVDPETVEYIEAHGTGTALGDPIEIAALSHAFREYTAKKEFCAIGSVKTNIGHLDKAAGIAGLIKTVLALQHGKLPPSLHFQQPNPQIDFASSPFYVNTHLREWPTKSTPRRAGVSSFGMGGTNVHMLLEEAPHRELDNATKEWQALVLSARTPAALITLSQKLADHLKHHPTLSLADVAYTLQLGRKSFEQRSVAVCRDVEDAIKVLNHQEANRLFFGSATSPQKQIVFMFPGQGSQYIGMGRDLYRQESTFRTCVDHCATFLETLLGVDLRAVLGWHLELDEQPREQVAVAIDQTRITQPVLFVIEYALAQLLRTWGIEPDVMIGHSIGEYVVAALAGVFSLDDALTIVALRAQLMQQLPAGAMLSVALSEQEILPFLHGELALAAVNAPEQCVVSGSFAAVEHCIHLLTEKNVQYHRLRTSHAFHSAMVEPMLPIFAEKLREVTLHAPAQRYISNLTGTWVAAEQASSHEYWVQQLRHTVYFSQGIQQIIKERESIFIEVGPGRVLTGLARQHQQSAQSILALTTLPIGQISAPQGGERAGLLSLLGQLWLVGCSVNWSSSHEAEHCSRIALPLYPFERQRYWLEVPATDDIPSQNISQNVSRLPLHEWFSAPYWKQALLPALSLDQARGTVQSPWLLFGDQDDAICEYIRELLVSSGQTVILVQAGKRFTRNSPDVYTLALDRPADYRALFEELRAQNIFPAKIIHMWLASIAQGTGTGRQKNELLQQRGFYSLLFLTQAIDHINWMKPLHIYMITDRMLGVANETGLSPEQATIIGLSKVITQEYPSITCACIDVVWSVGRCWEAQRLARQLLVEVTCPITEQVVAYRANSRWMQVYEPLRLNDPSLHALPLREKGAYLIAGGTGRLGLLWARWLAEHSHARLLLTAHSPWPEKDQWTQYLQEHLDDEMSKKIRIVQELEQLGAEAIICVCDLSDEQQVQGLFATIDQHFGVLHGLIYAAGITGAASFRSIQETDRDFCERHFRSKVAGLLAFDPYLHERELDFCLLQSSLSSMLGGLGFAAYAAANSFMDAWAYTQGTHSPVPWISINWDGWQFIAGEVERGIIPEEGLRVFPQLLSAPPISQVLVSCENLEQRLRQSAQPAQSREQGGSHLAAFEIPLHSRPVTNRAFVAPRNGLEQTVAEVWRRVLGIAEVSIYDDFFELGGHSLLAARVTTRLREAFEVEVPLRCLFDASTLEQQAEVIEELLIAKLEALSDEEAQRLMQLFSLH